MPAPADAVRLRRQVEVELWDSLGEQHIATFDSYEAAAVELSSIAEREVHPFEVREAAAGSLIIAGMRIMWPNYVALLGPLEPVQFKGQAQARPALSLCVFLLRARAPRLIACASCRCRHTTSFPSAARYSCWSTRTSRRCRRSS